MIDTLRNLGVETQAIEQPLDMTVPENKMILAVYLTTPEIENDRRSLNVKQGMHQARKEGRWLGVAPPGYINKIRENGEKFVDIDEPEASHMKWAFEELAKGVLNTKDVWVLAKKRGLTCSQSSFWKALRNVGYCGIVPVPKYKDEETHIVKGLHEAIISTVTFYEVQEVLEGRQRKTGQGNNRGVTITSPEKLPLRGFLRCDRCPRVLTGSATKGRNNHFYYYHCRSTCGWRQKAELVDEKFIKKLKEFVPKPEAVEVYQEILLDLFKDSAKLQLGERKKLMEELSTSNDRIIKARELLLEDTLTSDEYKRIKDEAEKKISTIEARIVDINSNNKNSEKWDVQSIIYKAVESFKKLDLMYVNADIEGKRKIISSIFAEKWQFQNGEHRTGKIHKAAELIFLINSSLKNKKNRIEN